jgi:hypothetical protein
MMWVEYLKLSLLMLVGITLVFLVLLAFKVKEFLPIYRSLISSAKMMGYSIFSSGSHSATVLFPVGCPQCFFHSQRKNGDIQF